MEITLSIIGTAFRKDDKEKCSRQVFDSMVFVANELLTQLKDSNYPIGCLVSGGAGGADHVAVKLFLNKVVPNLRLYIPCQFSNGSFEDEWKKIKLAGRSNMDKNISPAQTLNYYHNIFQRKTSINSLTEIQLAFNEGAEVLSCKGGFHGRNAMVAKSDIILAMTFGKENILKEGGSADTLRRYLARVKKEGFFDKSFHYNLNDGKVYTGAVAPEKVLTSSAA